MAGRATGPAVPPFASAQDAAFAARFFEGRDQSRSVWEQVAAAVAGFAAGDAGPPVVQTSTKSRVALLARTRFLWCPQTHLAGTIFVRFWFPTDIDSPRLRRDMDKSGKWSHRIRLGPPGPDALDDEVLGWLRAAYRFDVG